MNAKILIAAVLFLFISGASVNSFATKNLTEISVSNNITLETPKSDDFKYVYVEINQEAWIYVYAPDGSLVDCYREYE